MKDCVTQTCIGRREFLVKAGLVAGGAVLTVSAVGNVFAVSPFEDVVVAISTDSPLAKVGGSQVVDSSAGKIIVIRIGESKFAAYSAMCTHKRGPLSYDGKQLACPKHGSKFDVANGSVANGPAETPLAAYKANGGAESVTIVVGT
jgi:nitrite reductase/ring-hydroxylating ferredoxin subunit